jgi:iron(III) transport system permease protein
VPLAYFTVRFDFRGALLIQTLGVLPLIMPPFVGAVALQLIFGRSGQREPAAARALRLHPAHHGGAQRGDLRRGIHYFPFILMNLTVALRNIDGAMEEAAHEPGLHAAGGCSGA